MSNARKALISLAVSAACAYGVYAVGSSLLSDGEATGTKRLANQLWIERMPADERDMVGYLAALNTEHGRFGVAGRASQWRQMTEVFRWALDGDQMTTVFPQDRVRAKFRVRTWDCRGEAPRPFELCLEIGRGNRSHTFYSRSEWEIRPGGTVAGVEDHPALTAVAETLPGELVSSTDSDESSYDEAGPDWALIPAR